MHLYRTNTGTLLKTLYSKKYGCSCVTFTHASQAVVYASKVKAASKDPRKDHALRYHSLHDNTYLRYFVGHTKQVVSVSMSAGPPGGRSYKEIWSCSCKEILGNLTSDLRTCPFRMQGASRKVRGPAI